MCSQDWIRNKYKGVSFFTYHHKVYHYLAVMFHKMFITTYFILIDADNEDGQSFWSCLQDIQEGIQVKYKYFHISYTNLHIFHI